MPKVVKGARIACLDMNLQKARMHFGVQVRWMKGWAAWHCLVSSGIVLGGSAVQG